MQGNTLKNRVLLLLMCMMAMVACHRKTAPSGSDELGSGKRRTETGNASYYADKFIGRPTASGEKYNANAYTAAHRKLAFGTKVKVTNVANGKSVVVRINDRGPFVSGRIIDLSKAAAQKIGLIAAGVAKVKIEYVD